MVPSAGGGVLACPTLPLPRVAGRRPHTCAMTMERFLMDNGRDAQTTRPQGRRANTGDRMESQG